GIVERAEIALVLGPPVCAVRVHGEREIDVRHSGTRRTHRRLVPAGFHLDLHPPVAELQCLVHTAREGVGLPVLRDAEGLAAGDARGWLRADSVLAARRGMGWRSWVVRHA